MTGLPQGVTLDRQPYSVYHNVRAGGRLIGWAWPDKDALYAGAWYALPDATRQRGHGVRRFRTKAAAVRWLWLLARPVVYRVAPVRSPHEPRLPFAWAVYDPAGVWLAQEYDHGRAVTVAHAEAQRAVRLVVVSG